MILATAQGGEDCHPEDHNKRGDEATVRLVLDDRGIHSCPPSLSLFPRQKDAGMHLLLGTKIQICLLVPSGHSWVSSTRHPAQLGLAHGSSAPRLSSLTRSSCRNCGFLEVQNSLQEQAIAWDPCMLQKPIGFVS